MKLVAVKVINNIIIFIIHQMATPPSKKRTVSIMDSPSPIPTISGRSQFSANTLDAGHTPYASKKVKLSLNELRYSPMKAQTPSKDDARNAPLIVRKFNVNACTVAIMVFNSMRFKHFFDDFTKTGGESKGESMS